MDLPIATAVPAPVAKGSAGPTAQESDWGSYTCSDLPGNEHAGGTKVIYVRRGVLGLGRLELQSYNAASFICYVPFYQYAVLRLHDALTQGALGGEAAQQVEPVAQGHCAHVITGTGPRGAAAFKPA